MSLPRIVRRAISVFTNLRCLAVALLVFLAGAGAGCDSGKITGPTPTKLTISLLTPSAGPTGVAVAVTIKGTGFAAGATVTIDGTPQPAIVQNDTTIGFTAPAHGAGAVDVTVANPGVAKALRERKRSATYP
jgi:hypothetical protein